MLDYSPLGFNCCDQVVSLKHPLVMGVLNATNDSFYAVSRQSNIDEAFDYAKKMVDSGAHIIDIGGESTSQMAKRYSYKDNQEIYVNLEGLMSKPSPQQEMDRVIPIVEKLARELDCLISVDTSSPQVMHAAAHAGAHIINDIRAFSELGAIETMKQNKLAMVVCHSLLKHPAEDFVFNYENVVDDVFNFLHNQCNKLSIAGIASNRLIVDPGFGGGIFGKNVDHNFKVLANLKRMKALNFPLLIGVSRKSFIGKMTHSAPEERLAGSLVCAVLALQSGAQIVRTHDVKETVDAISILEKVSMF